MLKYTLIFLTVIILASCQVSGLSHASSEVTYTDVIVYWSTPTQRVNGDVISEDDIAGYEIRYKATDEEEYRYTIINDANKDQSVLTGIVAGKAYTFEVAAIDTYGIYSKYALAIQ